LTNLSTQTAIPLLFGTNGAERGRFDSSGNFHINDTTGVSRMTIADALAAPATSGSAANAFFRLKDSAGSRVLDFGQSSTYGWLQARDANTYAVNYNLVLQLNGGTLGVGGVASQKFDIFDTQGSFSATGNAMMRIVNASGTGQSPLDFVINGTLRSRLRSDFAGNTNYVSNGGGHSYYVGGDSGVGTNVFAISSAGVASAYTGSALAEVGYRSLIVSIPADASALVASQRGAMIASGFTSLVVNTGVFARGDIVTIYQDNAANMTLTQGAGFTLRLNGTATTGNRTILGRGVATLVFNGSSEAIVSGAVT
jgi:hypothetical protein